ncbi:tRNA pseudouridine synthase B, partial [Dissostichus eleginoides]
QLLLTCSCVDCQCPAEGSILSLTVGVDGFAALTLTSGLQRPARVLLQRPDFLRGETLSEGTVSALMEWLAKAWGQMGRGGRRKRKRGRKGEGVGGSKRSPHLESLQVSPGPGHER